MNWDELIAECSFEPVVERPRSDMPAAIVAGGMGGSALALRALEFFELPVPVVFHEDYGIPRHAPRDALHIAVSYSGTTEETLSFASDAQKDGRSVAVVASGGALAEFARREGLPFVQVPAGYPPRYALLYLVRAVLALVDSGELLEAIATVSVDKERIEAAAEEDAKALVERVPIYYASNRNSLLTRLAKLTMNESAHLPAFRHAIPEMNHEELESYDTDIPEGLEHLFAPVIFSDDGDDARILRRMDILESLLGEMGKTTMRLHMDGMPRATMLVETWLRLLAAAEHLARVRGIDPSAAPLVARFKKLL